MQFCKNTNIETVISYTLRCHAMLKNRCNDDPDVEHRLVLEKRGVYDKATEQYKSALRVRLSLFGRKHVSVAESMNAVGVMTHHHLKVRVKNLVLLSRGLTCVASELSLSVLMLMIGD